MQADCISVFIFFSFLIFFNKRKNTHSIGSHQVSTYSRNPISLHTWQTEEDKAGEPWHNLNVVQQRTWFKTSFQFGAQMLWKFSENYGVWPQSWSCSFLCNWSYRELHHYKTSHTIPKPHSKYNIPLAFSGPGKGRENNVFSKNIFSMCSTKKPEHMHLVLLVDACCKYMSTVWVRALVGLFLVLCCCYCLFVIKLLAYFPWHLAIILVLHFTRLPNS